MLKKFNGRKVASVSVGAAIIPFGMLVLIIAWATTRHDAPLPILLAVAAAAAAVPLTAMCLWFIGTRRRPGVRRDA